MFILWTITVIMTMQREIGLVSSNTLGWIFFILMVITLIVLLGYFLQKQIATWYRGVSWRVFRPIKVQTTSRMIEMKV